MQQMTGHDSKTERKLFDRLVPMNRWGEPEEIAQAVVWLCSDGASFVTGHVMPVDGGFVAQ
jgi:NAD(P)-dependent dehydrogenase (short-subunit alcohol dehydrogenase family)